MGQTTVEQTLQQEKTVERCVEPTFKRTVERAVTRPFELMVVVTLERTQDTSVEQTKR